MLAPLFHFLNSFDFFFRFYYQEASDSRRRRNGCRLALLVMSAAASAAMWTRDAVNQYGLKAAAQQVSLNRVIYLRSKKN
jgi:hypothetical protein